VTLHKPIRLNILTVQKKRVAITQLYSLALSNVQYCTVFQKNNNKCNCFTVYFAVTPFCAGQTLFKYDKSFTFNHTNVFSLASSSEICNTTSETFVIFFGLFYVLRKLCSLI